MKKRVRYTVLAEVLEPHETAMVEAYLAHDYIKMENEQQKYQGLLSAAGWTAAEFDAEMLHRIDQGWDIKTAPPRGKHPALASRSGGIAGSPHCKRTIH